MSKKRKLKIAIFHLAFIYSGGGEKLVLEEARGLTKLGHSVTIYTPVVNRDSCFPDILTEFDIKTFLPRLPFVVPGHESFQVLLTCALAPIFAWRFGNFDVVLAANQPSSWIAWVVKKMTGVPYVSYLAQPTRFLYPRKVDEKMGLIFTKKASESLSARIMKLFRKFIAWADRRSIRSSDVILANGSYIKGVLEKTYGIKAISCPAGAYLGESINSFKSRSRGKLKISRKVIEKPYLLVTNRHFPQKRFEYAVSSLATLLKDFPDLSLVITGGETDYTEQVKSLVKRLSLNNKVKFLGLVSERDLCKLYRNALTYLYTAPEEDFGMGVVEAMAQGTPVVAWNSAGPAKIIKDGKTGLLAEPHKVADFTDKISRTLSEQKLAVRISRQAWEEVKNRFSYKNHLAILEKYLQISSK